MTGVGRQSRRHCCPGRALLVSLPQHPYEHRPERPVLLAVDQELGGYTAGSLCGAGSRCASSSKKGATEPIPPE